MALRALMLKRKLDDKRKELEDLRAKDADFETREANLEISIEEAQTEDEKAAVEEEIGKFETENTAHQEAKKTLEREISELEEEQAELERKKPEVKAPEVERRTVNMSKINIRTLPMSQRAFDAFPMEERTAMVQREDVKAFLSEIRSMKGQQRAVQGASLTIPIVFLDLISENMYRYSKLLNRVRVREVSGEARQTIAGTVPEAVWTEMCGAINELTFVFNQITLDGYKVAGFVPVCNSILEDNDINLASWIVEMLSESIGLALDKAILYGKGAASKMPLGIVTRLAQESKPSDYPATAPEWVDYHTTNIQKVDGTADAVAFWAALTLAAGNTFTKYSRGNQFWAMNSKTLAKLRSKLIDFTASDGLVARFDGVMPIVNGDVDVLEFIPDGDIIGGYGDLYLLADRGAMKIQASTEVQFIQDNTVFKGTRRADGQPVIPGAFVAININNTAVTTAMAFAADTANDATLQSLAIGKETLAPTFDPGVYTYAITASAASDKVDVVPAQAGAYVAISYNGKNVNNGGTITWATGAKALAITVKQGNTTRVYTVTVTKS